MAAVARGQIWMEGKWRGGEGRGEERSGKRRVVVGTALALPLASSAVGWRFLDDDDAVLSHAAAHLSGISARLLHITTAYFQDSIRSSAVQYFMWPLLLLALPSRLSAAYGALRR